MPVQLAHLRNGAGVWIAYHGRLITPGFVAHSFGEEPIRSANSNVQNQIEWLVEGGVGLARRSPWVVESRIVHELLAETSSVPHELVEFEEEDLLSDCQKTEEGSEQKLNKPAIESSS